MSISYSYMEDNRQWNILVSELTSELKQEKKYLKDETDLARIFEAEDRIKYLEKRLIFAKKCIPYDHNKYGK